MTATRVSLSVTEGCGIDVSLTTMMRAGRAATTAAVNTRVMILGGLEGSALNIWCISGSFP